MLQKGLPGVNTKMLTKQLRELEEDGVIRRTVYPEEFADQLLQDRFIAARHIPYPVPATT